MDMREKIEEIMKEPAAVESFSDYEAKVRRNLILGSSIAALIVIFNLRISEGSSLLGIKFEGLNDQVIFFALVFFIGYQLIHFIWIVKNKIQYWRVRLTGTKAKRSFKPRPTLARGLHATDHDYPEDPRQSNFYVWMLEHKLYGEHLEKKTLALLESFEALLEEEKRALSDPDDKARLLHEAHSARLEQIREALSEQTKLVNHLRINASMLRFDSWFNCLVKSESIRWFLFEAGFPLIFGVLSLLLVVDYLYFVILQ